MSQLLVLFPFEEPLYREAGIGVTYVNNDPLFPQFATLNDAIDHGGVVRVANHRDARGNFESPDPATGVDYQGGSPAGMARAASVTPP